ncbi:hypothetical protein V2J09_007492 [Rumex salicifolius]
MAEVDDSQQQEVPVQDENLTQKLEKMNISSSFNIWPPSERTREAVINRLIDTLSNPSVLSKRYGSMPPEEAAAAARSIEEEAFNAAGGSSAESASIDDGIEILQVYSKEISTRLLGAVKSRSSEASQDVSSIKSPDEAPTVTSEEGSISDLSGISSLPQWPAPLLLGPEANTKPKLLTNDPIFPPAVSLNPPVNIAIPVSVPGYWSQSAPIMASPLAATGDRSTLLSTTLICIASTNIIIIMHNGANNTLVFLLPLLIVVLVL